MEARRSVSAGQPVTWIERALRRLAGPPTLDLHGYGVRDALTAVDRFLDDAVAGGVREVRVVYGKGRGSPGGVGVLRQAVPSWLEQHGRGRVARFERSLDGDGCDGALRVWLAPPVAPSPTAAPSGGEEPS